jgi:hypothetical protein
MIIREAKATVFEEIWPIFHEIASLGDTYAYQADISREDAEKLWMKLPRKTYSVPPSFQRVCRCAGDVQMDR